MYFNCGVYGIFSTENGECLYIGESTRITIRWKQHLNALINESHVRKDFVEWFKVRLFQESTLDFRILELCNPELLGEIECKWFNLLSPNFYGQIPHPGRSWKFTEESNRKKSIASKTILEIEDSSIWKRTLKKHGYKKAIELTSAKNGFHKHRDVASVNGKMQKGIPKTDEHKHKISESLLKRSSSKRINKHELEKQINLSPTNYTKLSEFFSVSRPTIRKWVKEYGLEENLNNNRLSEYEKIECGFCKKSFAKTIMYRHQASHK